MRLVPASAGIQTVRFCADPDGNGCADATDVCTVSITWGEPTGSVTASVNTNWSSPPGGPECTVGNDPVDS